MIVGVLGADTTGRGIAQVGATAGHRVAIRDADPGLVERGVESIGDSLDEGVERGELSPEERDAAPGRITGTTRLVEAVANADLDEVHHGNRVEEAQPDRSLGVP